MFWTSLNQIFIFSFFTFTFSVSFHTILLYLAIFFGKIIEVSMMALRIVFISKGEKKIGSLVAFFEVSIWLIIAANVLDNLLDEPIKAVVYAFGFIAGNYVGSLLEQWLSIGTAQIQIIVREDNGMPVRQALYDAGFACTTVQGEGHEFKRNVIYTIVARKSIQKVINATKSVTENAVITVHETKPYHGGYGLTRTRLRK